MLRNRLNRPPLLGKWFWLAYALMLFALFGMSIPQWLISTDWGAIHRSSALQQALMPVYFGGTMLLFPFSACVSYAPRQVDDIKTGFIFWRLARGGIGRYTRTHLLGAFFASGLAIGLAFLTHAALWSLIAMPSDPLLYSSHEIPYAADCIYLPWLTVLNGWTIIGWAATGMCIVGGVWGTIGLMVAQWIPDKLLSVSLSAFLYFLWNSQAWLQLFGVDLPHMSDLYNDALTWPMVRRSLLSLALLYAAAAITYYFGVRRRAKHG